MAELLTTKATEMGLNYDRINFVCQPSKDYKCRAHRNLSKDNSFEPHNFFGLQSKFSFEYAYISFSNENEIPFNPLTRGMDLNSYGDAQIFGKHEYDHFFKDRANITLFPLELDNTEDENKTLAK